MCGFVGFWSKYSHSNTTFSILKAMSDKITHRGPDGGHEWLDEEKGIGLAHRRLSIVDLSPAGQQPMHSADGRYVIAFNGEIYNFEELRKELEDTGHAPQWKGHSDTEVMLAAFPAWGIEAALKKFTGMFAFAMWDRELKQLTLARDRFGEKPLYYAWRGQTLIFGSELKGLRQHPALKECKIDRNALCLYLRYNNVPAPHTIYEDVFKLPPATWVQWSESSDSAQVPTSYWSLSDSIRTGHQNLFKGNENDAANELETILKSAIKKQMIADVPLGAFLSGGIDSSLIVALMQTQSSVPVKTFTIGFHEASMNEAEYAKAVAYHLGTQHTEWYVTPKDALDVIPNLPELFDEPFADSSQIPTFLVSKIARQHVTVSLSGDAGDELFGGYSRYYFSGQLWNKLRLLPASGRGAIAKSVLLVPPSKWDAWGEHVLRYMPAKFQKYKNIGDKIHKLAGAFGAAEPFDLYKQLISLWPEPEAVVLGAKEPKGLINQPEAWPEGLSFTEQMMFLDTLTYLPDDILAKVDRASMGVSLETRAPLLDHSIAEFAWRLPLDMKIRGGRGKLPLRNILYKYVPQHLIDRPKQGFCVPIDQWLRYPLKEWANLLLHPQRLRKEGYFNADIVTKCWNEHLSGKRNWQHRLWAILMFQAWVEHSGT